ncbi:DUF7577 domain-containing protein [Natrinema amylolyticum]|nr:hypothetical protein [Natrinema amylolyticum]
MSTTSETTRQQCPVCRTENDFFYTYCRQCLAELPTRTARSTSI